MMIHYAYSELFVNPQYGIALNESKQKAMLGNDHQSEQGDFSIEMVRWWCFCTYDVDYS